MTLSDADLVRASRGIDNPQVEVHLNPGHVKALQKVQTAVREDVLDRAKVEKALRDAIPHSETSYTNVFIGWAADALVNAAKEGKL